LLTFDIDRISGDNLSYVVTGRNNEGEDEKSYGDKESHIDKER
jgi:hypothetical protein